MKLNKHSEFEGGKNKKNLIRILGKFLRVSHKIFFFDKKQKK